VNAHLPILPVLIPVLSAAVMVALSRQDLVLARVLSFIAAAAQLVVALLLFAATGEGEILVYRLGDWPAPYGIALVADRLSAAMVLLTAILGAVLLLHAVCAWDRRGRHFHPLFQFQLMGIYGAFLTGDFFNLFVFFEVMLIASYGLMVHGGGAARLTNALQYMVVNLIASSLFLFAVALIYNAAGTLNFADLAQRVPTIPSSDRGILMAGGTLLCVVFLLKAAVVPLQFWLPGAYGYAPGVAAALFALLSKVGAYALLRFALVGLGWSSLAALEPLAWLTLLTGALGVLAAPSLGVLAGFASISSIGVLFVGLAGADAARLGAGLYYLVHSTLAGAALFVLADLVRSVRREEGDALVGGREFSGRALLGGLFFLVAIVTVGLPPLSGFVGKLAVLRNIPVTVIEGAASWVFVLVTSFLLLLGLSRAGSRVFWKTQKDGGQASHGPAAGGVAALALLLAGTVVWALVAGPALAYFTQAAQALLEPGAYVQAVMGAGVYR
jgi:multicomponent K+:H+ antiporter subunit D